MPVSDMVSTCSGDTVIVTVPLGVYLMALDKSYSIMNSSHFSSVSTFIWTGS